MLVLDLDQKDICKMTLCPLVYLFFEETNVTCSNNNEPVDYGWMNDLSIVRLNY